MKCNLRDDDALVGEVVVAALQQVADGLLCDVLGFIVSVDVLLAVPPVFGAGCEGEGGGRLLAAVVYERLGAVFVLDDGLGVVTELSRRCVWCRDAVSDEGHLRLRLHLVAQEDGDAERCRKARLEILNEIMIPCIAKPRDHVSEFAPKMLTMKIDVDKIREVIGKGGSMIQKIVAESGAQVDIDDDGTIHIASPDAASCDVAKKMIDDICFVPEVGKLYYGKVVRILPIGAFVELAPGKDGMIHISKLENHRVEKVEDVLNVGDMTWVKVTEIDEKGRVNLSRKDALKELAAAADKK